MLFIYLTLASYLSDNFVLLYKYGISMNKIFTYASFSKPLVVYGPSPLRSLFPDFVIYLEADNQFHLSETLYHLASLTPGEIESLGQQTYDYYFQKHDYHFLAEQMNATLKALARC